MKAIIAFILMLLSSALYAQQLPQCLPEEHLWRHGTSVEKLNKAYPSLLQALEEKDADSNKIQQFNQNARLWFTQLATYLKDNGIRLSEKEPLLFRMYVNKNNQVQFLVYKKTGGWKKRGRIQKQLHRHLEAFMKLNPVNFGISGPWSHSLRLKVE